MYFSFIFADQTDRQKMAVFTSTMLTDRRQTVGILPNGRFTVD